MLTIDRLDAQHVRANLDGLAAVLFDCVDGDASVGFMHPFTLDDARAFFESVIRDVEAGSRVLLAAYDDGEIVGTVQVAYPWQPNQPHRADIAKLLVHRKARGKGVAQQLMERAEREALADGKTVLVLDTVTGTTAFRLYQRLGWVEVGEVPDFALYPDGRRCPTTFFYKHLATAE